ncbi:MAG: hypothetical protein CVV44_20315 [Spirochaetae bacterium HGW-Spirochaetae-1]|jgi:hypothetical protein|nr:MAG: hypothetical protein CVV44_20315 [Spirochaetae bacterium HGW-Spirochaetae-1]
MADNYNIIQIRRHDKLDKWSGVFKLNHDSYVSGRVYRDGNYLHKGKNEFSKFYKQRQEIATPRNDIQPVIDILIGYVYSTEPERNIDGDVKNALFSVAKGKDYARFTRNVARQLKLYPFVVLVDSPSDVQDFKTKYEKDKYGKNPYCLVYRYDEIRDFSLDDNGRFTWLLLDNSYVDKTDPLGKEKKITRYTLWMVKNGAVSVRDFIIKDKKVEPQEEMPLAIAEIPAIIAGKDFFDEDIVETNLIENCSEISKKLYNIDSLIDSILYDGAFKVLRYPLTDFVKELPKGLKSEGLGSVAVLEFDGMCSNAPDFIRAEVDNIQPYLDKAKEMVKEFFKQFGMKDTSETETKYWGDSGVAKSIDFQKTKGILLSIADEMEIIENEIVRYIGMWMNKSVESKSADKKITYNKDFDPDELNDDLNRLYQAMELPYETITKYAVEQIVRKLFPKADKKVIEAMIKEIHEGVKTPKVKFDDDKNDGGES